MDTFRSNLNFTELLDFMQRMNKLNLLLYELIQDLPVSSMI